MGNWTYRLHSVGMVFHTTLDTRDGLVQILNGFPKQPALSVNVMQNLFHQYKSTIYPGYDCMTSLLATNISTAVVSSLVKVKTP